MRPSFLRLQAPYLAVIVNEPTPARTIATILNCEHDGGEGFMVDVAGWSKDDLTPESLKRVFHSTGRPCMPLCYRSGVIANISDDERAELILTCMEAGAAACDIMGDFYDRAPRERTRNAAAIERQKQLIGRVHDMGAEVLMSSHVTGEFMSAEEVLEHMLDFEARGADIAKIVTRAQDDDELLESFRTTVLLKRTLKVPFVHLCSGKGGRLQRYVAPMLGATLTFGVPAYTESMQGPQPLVRNARATLDELGCHKEYD